MDNQRIARELVRLAKEIGFGRTAYNITPSAKKRPMSDDDVAEVSDIVHTALEGAYANLRMAKKTISRAADSVEGSRVNLNFVQLGAQAPGSVIDDGMIRRVHRATRSLEDAEKVLDQIYKNIQEAEGAMVQASKELA